SGLTASAAPAAAPALPWKPPLLLGTPESTSNSSSDTEDVRLAETFRDLKIDYLAVDSPPIPLPLRKNKLGFRIILVRIRLFESLKR
ncbi:hypothetical protein LTR28_005520, partial [Elasticomyces elasticus]